MDSLFKRCLIVSAALHIGLVVLGNLKAASVAGLPRPEMIIDMTLPLRRIASPPPGKLGRPGLPAVPVVKTPDPIVTPVVSVPPDPAPVPVADPRPAPPEPQLSPPAVLAVPAGAGSGTLGSPSGAPSGDPAATGGGGTGPGARSRTPDMMPRLLNKAEVLKNLRRFYPVKEWDTGQEAQVVVKIRIDAGGEVEAVDIITSAGTAFDDGARSVAKRMKFSPAMLGGKAIPVAFPQLLIFKLE